MIFLNFRKLIKNGLSKYITRKTIFVRWKNPEKAIFTWQNYVQKTIFLYVGKIEKEDLSKTLQLERWYFPTFGKIQKGHFYIFRITNKDHLSRLLEISKKITFPEQNYVKKTIFLYVGKIEKDDIFQYLERLRKVTSTSFQSPKRQSFQTIGNK